jgi:hypothetical protein
MHGAGSPQAQRIVMLGQAAIDEKIALVDEVINGTNDVPSPIAGFSSAFWSGIVARNPPARSWLRRPIWYTLRVMFCFTVLAIIGSTMYEPHGSW